jgi:hypothetical protein
MSKSQNISASSLYGKKPLNLNGGYGKHLDYSIIPQFSTNNRVLQQEHAKLGIGTVSGMTYQSELNSDVVNIGKREIDIAEENAEEYNALPSGYNYPTESELLGKRVYDFTQEQTYNPTISYPQTYNPSVSYPQTNPFPLPSMQYNQNYGGSTSNYPTNQPSQRTPMGNIPIIAGVGRESTNRGRRGGRGRGGLRPNGGGGPSGGGGGGGGGGMVTGPTAAVLGPTATRATKNVISNLTHPGLFGSSLQQIQNQIQNGTIPPPPNNDEISITKPTSSAAYLPVSGPGSSTYTRPLPSTPVNYGPLAAPVPGQNNYTAGQNQSRVPTGGIKGKGFGGGVGGGIGGFLTGLALNVSPKF